MAETAIPIVDVRGPEDNESLALASQMTVVTTTAADATNGFSLDLRRPILVLVENSDAGAQTITFTSQLLNGRTATITDFSLAAGAMAARIFRPQGWANSSQKLVGTVSNAAIKIWYCELPV